MPGLGATVEAGVAADAASWRAETKADSHRVSNGLRTASAEVKRETLKLGVA